MSIPPTGMPSLRWKSFLRRQVEHLEGFHEGGYVLMWCGVVWCGAAWQSFAMSNSVAFRIAVWL